MEQRHPAKPASRPSFCPLAHCSAFFWRSWGPLVYNQAVADVQERLQSHISEFDIEVHEDEFQYWRKYDSKRKHR